MRSPFSIATLARSLFAAILLIPTAASIAEDEPVEPAVEETPVAEETPEATPADESTEAKPEEEKPSDEKPDETTKPAEEEPAEKPAEEKPEDEPKEEEKPKDEAKPEDKPTEEKPEPKPEEMTLTPEVVVVNLENPSGVTVHGGTGHVFIASRYGIHRYAPENHASGKDEAAIALEVAGYPTDTYGKGPTYNIGPLGVTFLDDEHLVVGDGSRKDGEELVRVYKVGPKMPTPDGYTEEENAVVTLGPIPKGEQTRQGEGNFYGVTVAAGRLFVTNNGDDTKGWISSAKIENGKPETLELYIATKENVTTDAPCAITTTPDGKQIVVGQMGEISKPGDSLVCLYNPETGELDKSYETGLHDIVGLAYHPETGDLYAVDFAWFDTTKGGLYKLSMEGDEVSAEKLASLDKPTSLAFDKKGNLYVTVIGTDDNTEDDRDPGQVLFFDMSPEKDAEAAE